MKTKWVIAVPRSRHDLNCYTTPRIHGSPIHGVSAILLLSKPAYQAETTDSTSKVRMTWNLEVTWALPLLFIVPVLIQQINS